MRKIFFFLFVCLVNTTHNNAQIITTIAGSGTFGNTGDGGPAISANMGDVSGILVDENGIVYISDGSYGNVRKVDASGVITTFAGSSITSFSGDGGPATNATLSHPDGLAIDKVGNIYIADQGNCRVRKVDLSGIITTYAGSGTGAFSGDGGPATAAKIGIGGVIGICFDTSGNLYIAGANRIRKVDINGIISTYAGTGIGGSTGDGGPATAANISTYGQIFIDIARNLYITPGSSFSGIRKINSSGIISTITGGTTVGFNGDNGLATSAKINTAIGIFSDECGNLYFADSYNNRIRKIDGHNIITTIAGTGVPGYSGDGSAAVTAALDTPSMIWLDKYGNIFIADEYNSCVRKITMNGCHSVIKVPEVIPDNGITLYPNPATDELTIKTQQDTYRSFTITNSLGRQLIQHTITNPQTTISVRTLPAGVYYISLRADTETSILKFVKM